MSYAQQMLDASPSKVPDTDVAVLAACIEACFDCAQSCTTCADACLAEEDLGMLARCIRRNLHCADVCATTGRVLSRQEMPELSRVLLEACLLAVRLCAEECERHADHHAHCRINAEACRRCEAACQRLLAALPA